MNSNDKDTPIPSQDQSEEGELTPTSSQQHTSQPQYIQMVQNKQPSASSLKDRPLQSMSNPFFQKTFHSNDSGLASKHLNDYIGVRAKESVVIEELSNEQTFEQQQMTPSKNAKSGRELENQSMASEFSIEDKQEFSNTSLFNSNPQQQKSQHKQAVFDYTDQSNALFEQKNTKKRKLDQISQRGQQPMQHNEELKQEGLSGYYFLQSRSGQPIGQEHAGNDDSDATESKEDQMVVESYRNSEGVLIKKVRSSQLRQLWKSKQEIYSILTTQGQYYLPSYSDCTVDFLKQIFSGAKKVLMNNEVKIVTVPKLSELSAKRLIADVQQDKLVSSYLPDIGEGKFLNRQYLFNIINTLRPSFFKDSIHQSLKDRQDQAALVQKKYVEISEDLYHLVTSSINLKVNPRGKAIGMLNYCSTSRSKPQKTAKKVLKKRISEYPTALELEQAKRKQNLRQYNDDSSRGMISQHEGGVYLRGSNSSQQLNISGISQIQPQNPVFTKSHHSLTEQKKPQ